MRKKWKGHLVLLLAVWLLFAGCGESTTTPTTAETTQATTQETTIETTEETTEATEAEIPISPLGSAEHIDGTTVIVSIFASDSTTRWDWSDQRDVARREKMRKGLKTATQWISQQTKAYGADSRFIYDWETTDGLYYEVKFSNEMVTMQGYPYADLKGYVEEEIDRTALLKKHNAQNIIFIFFYDTPVDNPENPVSFPSQNLTAWDLEIICGYVGFDGFEIPPSVIAHEILHTFGARDLYYANADIPQAFVDYNSTLSPQDIMYGVNAEDYISSHFSAVDAYYLGLIPQCDEVEKWHLGKSQFA